MSEQNPSYEQIAADLRAYQVATDIARTQRNAALNEVADVAARLDQAMTKLRGLVDENADLLRQVADLAAKLATAEPTLTA